MINSEAIFAVIFFCLWFITSILHRLAALERDEWEDRCWKAETELYELKNKVNHDEELRNDSDS